MLFFGSVSDSALSDGFVSYIHFSSTFNMSFNFVFRSCKVLDCKIRREINLLEEFFFRKGIHIFNWAFCWEIIKILSHWQSIFVILFQIDSWMRFPDPDIRIWLRIHNTAAKSLTEMFCFMEMKWNTCKRNTFHRRIRILLLRRGVLENVT